MTAITLRKLPPRVAREIQARASRDRTSLNRTVIRLLEERLEQPAGPQPGPDGLYHDLDWFIGGWDKRHAAEFDRELRAQRRVDPELWK